jgi:small subunit ribosomal protein S4
LLNATRDLDIGHPSVYPPANTGRRRSVLSFDVSRGFFAALRGKTLSGFENGGQRRARFLHPDHEVSGATFVKGMRMSKRESAKYKIDRRLGENIWGRPKSPLNRRESRPGQHGERRQGKLSDFGQQLKAKQKLKGYYGSISERQFRAAYDEASRLKGSTSEHLIGLLERRLDALVYRAKFVPTVFAARQFVSHGHVTVNGKRVTVPSYRLRIGDVIEVREKAKQLALVLEAIKSAERDVPDYVNADHNKMTASLTRVPALSDVPYPVQMEPNLVVEFYSR